MATILSTNFHKSLVVPIKCNHLNLEFITQSLPASRVYFPMRYLGLPLSSWQLSKVDLQFLKDKVAVKLVMYEGKNITTIGRTSLVKSVSTSQVVYFITPLVVTPSTLHNVNKLEQAFVWSGFDTTNKEKCKVIWEIVCQSHEYGGLGVLNTDNFACAL